MLGKAEGRRRRGQQMMKLLDSITNLMDTSLSKLQEIVDHRGAWHATACGSQRAEQNLAIEQQMYDHPCQLGQELLDLSPRCGVKRIELHSTSFLWSSSDALPWRSGVLEGYMVMSSPLAFIF